MKNCGERKRSEMANENKNASGIVQNFKLVYQKNWRQITSISPGEYI